MDYGWRSSVRWDLAGHPLSIEGSHGQLGASLGFQSEDERVGFKVYGKNLTNAFHTSGISVAVAVMQLLPVDYQRVLGFDATLKF